MAEWLEIFLAITPWMAWFFIGIGLPWALVLLPRHDWYDWPLVAAVAVALGPVFGTTWLFLLGTFAEFSLALAFAGTLIIAISGAIWAYRRRDLPFDSRMQLHDPTRHFPALRWALLVLLAVGMLANVWDTAFWPFLRYDTLWTFGYNPKIFMLEGHIPEYIDYYPQLVPLTFSFGQLAWGSDSDYAARVAVPWFILSSVLAAYALGWRLYQRRLVGLLTAALWLLTPSVLVWSSSGDLEHPMAIYFSMAVLFLVLAWRATDAASAQRYAVISGLMLAGLLWTKPTGGAFIGGMAILTVGAIFQASRTQAWPVARQRIWLLLKIGLVATPIGGMWYVRNIIAGHSWTNLPPAYWQDFAQRSGMQLNWLYYVAVLALSWIALKTLNQHHWRRLSAAILSGLLLSAAILPTMLSLPDEGLTQAVAWEAINGFREPIRALNGLEVLMLISGSLLLLWAGWPGWQSVSTAQQQAFVWSWGLGLPFFAVYFWAFSYHYRLALTVLPIVMAVIAALLVNGIMPFVAQNPLRRVASVVIVLLVGIPAPIAATYHTALNSFSNMRIDTTFEKYRYANPALLTLVDALQADADRNGVSHQRILAPGENRLSFFFPQWQIDDETLPADIHDLAGYDLFINFAADFLWQRDHLIPNQVQTWTEMAWIYPLGPSEQPLALDGPHQLPMPRVLRPLFTPIDDGTSRYEVYIIDDAAPYAYIRPETTVNDVVFGDGLRLIGYDLDSDTVIAGQMVTLKLYWQGTPRGPLAGDFSIFVHLTEPGEPTAILAQIDGGLLYGSYLTRFVTPHLIFQDRREWALPADLQPGIADIRIGVYEPVSNVRLPVTQNGVVEGDGFVLPTVVSVASENLNRN